MKLCLDCDATRPASPTHADRRSNFTHPISRPAMAAW